MCEFVSWKEYKNRVYFLKDADLNTKEGKKLLKPEVIADLSGHGAIENFYTELTSKGRNKECSDFSTPKNFPKEIIRAIKAGRLSRIGINLQLLNDKGKAEYEKVEQPAWAEYQKVEQPAWAEYEKVKQPAWAEYEKVKQSAWAEYEKVKQSAWAEYEKVKQSAWAEYQKVKQSAFWRIFKNLKNREEVWR